jgi:pSer/pThr/pTyr-binding forkhead associated (FHA) protein
MQDGHTRRVQHEDAPGRDSDAFLASHRAVIVTLSGTTAGNEYVLDRAQMTIGRGPDVELAFDDTTMSREHAAFEVIDGAMRLRDLGSTNGVLVNGSPVLQIELKHGDRIELGEHQFQFILEQRRRGPKTYDLSDG